MLHSKYIIATVFLFILCSVDGFSQFDSPSGTLNKGTTTGNLEANAKASKKATPINPTSNEGFKTAYKTAEKERKAQQNKALTLQKEVLTKATRAKKQLIRNMENKSMHIPMVDKELGTFRTTSNQLSIASFDFGKIDGDKIAVYKNDVLMVDNYELDRTSKLIHIPLDIGFNKIEIVAIDEGQLRPNTGNFTVYDDVGTIVLQDMWFLAKGAKVKAMVIREKQ